MERSSSSGCLLSPICNSSAAQSYRSAVCAARQPTGFGTGVADASSCSSSHLIITNSCLVDGVTLMPTSCPAS